MNWTIFFSKEAEDLLLRIDDRRIRKLLKDRAQRLCTHPEMQGKALGGDLAGLRSIRAVGQRYRIIYELLPEDREVWIIAVGIRKAGHKEDIYEVAGQLK
jgi:mRNA interferase RelE/StbE